MIVVEEIDADQIIDKPSEMRTRYDSLPVLAGSKLLRALFHDFDSASKLFALEGTVIYLMMRVLEDDCFSGLPKELQPLQECAAALESNRLAIQRPPWTRY